MPTVYMKAAVITAWMLAIGAIGFGLGVTSFAGWAAVGLLSLIPAAVMLLLWGAPAPRMSETIRDVLR